MLSVHTTTFCSHLFQELLGTSFDTARPQGCTNNLPPTPPRGWEIPPHFTLCDGHWQHHLTVGFQCHHKCYIAVVLRQNHLNHCA